MTTTTQVETETLNGYRRSHFFSNCGPIRWPGRWQKTLNRLDRDCHGKCSTQSVQAAEFRRSQVTPVTASGHGACCRFGPGLDPISRPSRVQVLAGQLRIQVRATSSHKFSHGLPVNGGVRLLFPGKKMHCRARSGPNRVLPRHHVRREWSKRFACFPTIENKSFGNFHRTNVSEVSSVLEIICRQ